MKKILLSLILLLFGAHAFAEDERVRVQLTGGNVYDNEGSVGPQNPCTNAGYIPIYRIPDGYSIPYKIEWYVNGVLKKTSLDPTKLGFDYSLTDRNTVVYFTIIYKTPTGQLSDEKSSTSFTIGIKSLNVSIINGPSNVELGCQNVSYSVSTTTGGFGYTPGPDELFVTWTPPANWTKTSSSSYEKNISYSTDG